jgi:hypothetical protein
MPPIPRLFWNEILRRNIVRRAGGQGWLVQMDILAPVFAYLTCVAGIIGAFAVSFFVVFSAPNGAATPQHSPAVVSVTASKTDMLAEAKTPVLKTAPADNSAVNHVAATTQKRETALPAKTPPQAAAGTALDARPKSRISRAQWREIVVQERSRRLAYQQNPDFESRFLGYAD